MLAAEHDLSWQFYRRGIRPRLLSLSSEVTMRKMLLFLIPVLVLALLCACNRASVPQTPAAEPESAPQAGTQPEEQPDAAAHIRVPDRTLTAAHYAADVFELAPVRQYGCTLEGREYVGSDAVTVRMYRAAGGGITGGVCTYYDKTLPEGTTMHYYTAGNQWVHGGLSEGTCAARFIYLEQPDGAGTILILPRTYTLRENDSLEYHPELDGTLSITKTVDGWRVTMRAFGLQEGRVADCMTVMADTPLLSWDAENCGDVWGYHTRNLSAKWCYTGYFRQSPDNYIPTGTQYYYRCAASYLIRDMVRKIPSDKAAAVLTVAMLDTMTQQQNSYGYWPTTPGSEWLQGDYGIGPGFYDTRFNTDLLEVYISAARRLGMGMFDEAIARYVGFFSQIADTSHISTKSGGWLIPDYWYPGELQTPHTSLNHQASECLALYHAADLLRRDDLRVLADRMLLAIEDTGSGWVMPDHNLYYSVLPDGTYLTGDYPYLTYNDLYALRKYLTGFGKEQNETLTLLMDEKLIWMRANGVAGYKTD